VGLAYAGYGGIVAWMRRGLAPSVEPEEKISTPELVKMLLIEAVPPLILILGILGTMLAGVATATEASAIGAFLALAIVVVRGKFEWRTFFGALYETGRTSAMILFRSEEHTSELQSRENLVC